MSELAEQVYTRSALACGGSISDLLLQAYHHTVAQESQKATLHLAEMYSPLQFSNE